MIWYVCFFACLILLLPFATERDRVPLRIILTASVIELLVVIFVTRQIHAPWKLVIPGAEELLTIAALLHFGQNRSAYIQAVLLLVAWLDHILCFVDVTSGSNIVYDNYETILAAVAVAQIIAFHDTVASIFSQVRGFCRDVRGYCASGVRVGNANVDVAGVLRDPDAHRVETPEFL